MINQLDDRAYKLLIRMLCDLYSGLETSQGRLARYKTGQHDCDIEDLVNDLCYLDDHINIAKYICGKIFQLEGIPCKEELNKNRILINEEEKALFRYGLERALSKQ